MKFFKSLLIALCCMFPIILSGCENENISSLSTPENLNISNGIISFKQVEDADYYSISINDRVFNIDSKYNSNVEIIDSTIRYNANKLLEYGQNYSIKVKARGNEKYDSHYTAVVDYVHSIELTVPNNVSVSANTLLWDSVTDASLYIVKVTHLTQNKTEEISCDINYCELTAILDKYGIGEYQFAVKAVRNGVSPVESEYSVVVNYVHYQQLSTPIVESVYQSGNDLKMNVKLDENANKITIFCDDDNRNLMLNGTSVYVSKSGDVTTLNLTGIFGADQFFVLKKYVFSVQAKYETVVSGYYKNSEVSEQVVFNKTATLEKPNVTYSYDSVLDCYLITWQAVEHSAGYIVSINNGIEYVVDHNQTTFMVKDFTNAKVKALGAGNYLDSYYSNVISK